MPTFPRLAQRLSLGAWHPFLLLYLFLTNLFLANFVLANFLLAKRLLVTFLLAPFFFFDIAA
ncbi:hypothetical protein EBB56_05540 [Halomonas sp. YLB-10]|uniref:hypothetical protein n=1 Tax=Halomonas sp. YLB-10 TaxID=2483111 RepID=UPI000F5F838C|nr:hypothetical protein [Halomonas sp. YLB-10]RQW71878.1 hypothetical protein EBB56_05540 [Halomonas sp. YLB-10]